MNGLAAAALAAPILGLTGPALATGPHEAGTEGHADDQQAHHRHHLGLFLGAAVREEEHAESGIELPPRRRSRLALKLSDREEASRGWAEGQSMREIASSIQRVRRPR